MTNTRKAELEALCRRFRIELIDVLHAIQTGHPGGSLSCCEMVTTLYQDIMNIDPKNPEMKGRDHFVLSKGHAAPMLYINLAEKGYFPKEEMKTLRQLGSRLQGHPCAHKLPGVEFSTGPLGLGLGAGLGIMLGDRLQGYASYTYVLLGDGEIEEGAIWEAAMAAAKFKADHLIAILDYNGVQLRRVQAHKGSPSIILAKTVKGKGISFMEGKNTWHGKAISDTDYAAAKGELEGKA